MRPSIREFAALAAETLPLAEPIYEFGSLQVPGQEGYADLRALFPGRKYVGADMREGPGVDVLLDLHAIDLPAESAGAVLCFETLEHVEDPRLALREIHRILKPDGIAVVTSPLNFPIHNHPNDYWRFTPEGLRSLLNPFPNVWVGAAGKDLFPRTVAGVGFKGAVPPLEEFQRRYEAWRKHNRCVFEGTGLVRVVKALAPPLIHPLLTSVHRGVSRLAGRRPG